MRSEFVCDVVLSVSYFVFDDVVNNKFLPRTTDLHSVAASSNPCNELNIVSIP